MITILTRLFPQDISEYIYNLLIKDYINTKLIGKIYNNCLIMEKHNIRYHEIVINRGLYYNPSLEYIELVNVCKFLKYVKLNFINKKYYNYDKYTKAIIKDFIIVLGFIFQIEDYGYISYNLKQYLEPLIKEILT
jgi:hypothetical protein